MISTIVEIIRLIQEANSQNSNYKRVLCLNKIEEKIDELFLYTRIANELFLFSKPEKKELSEQDKENSTKVYFYLSEKISELSKQNTGWKNYYTPQNFAHGRSEGKEMPPSALERA